MPSLQTILTTLALTSLLPAQAAKPCPPLGPVLPAPKQPSLASSYSKTTKALTAALNSQISSLNASAVSVGVKSLHEDKQLFKYHHTPSIKYDVGTEEIDETTIFRVGSVSKMVTTLGVLMEGVDMEASVLEYVPELGDVEGEVDWESISVRALADHLSGLGTDMAMDLAINPLGNWEEKGLPSVPLGSGPACSGLPGTQPCNKTDLVRDIGRRPLIYDPQTTPVYSNIAYAMLGLVLEGATGKPFAEVVKERIFDRVGMNSTSFDGFTKDFETKGFVPAGEVTWNMTLGTFEAAGGMFSSINDLLAFAEGIISNEFLSPLKTRSWMKPHSHTSSWGLSTGEGWEILRSDNITSDGRLIDVYTKSGDLGMYHALIGAVPEYGVSIAVLCAGPEVTSNAYARSIIFSAVVQALFPVLEEAAKSEAEAYTGTYADEDTNSTFVLSIDDGPGLVIEEFQVRGFDVMQNIDSYSLFATEAPVNSSSVDTPKVSGRLYPTFKGKSGKDNATSWRAVYDSNTEEQRVELQSQLFWKDATCESWFGLDRSVYNFASLAEFEFLGSGDVRNKAFNVTLAKVRNSSDDDGGDDENPPDSNDDGAVGTSGAGKSRVGMSLLVGTFVLILNFL